MAKKKRKLSKTALATIITSLIVVVLLAALLVFNAFIPVRYIEAYFVSASKNTRGNLRVTYVNVGFGDAAIIELPDGKTILVDGGDGSYPSNKAVLKALNMRGIDKIDYLVCTSVKSEHCGSLAEIMNFKEVEFAFIPYSTNKRITSEFYAFTCALEEREIDTEYACAGAGIEGDGYDYFMTFLSPSSVQNPESEYDTMNKRPDIDNVDNASAIVWVEYENVAFVFSSDVREAAQKRVVEEYANSKLLAQPFCPVGKHKVELEKCVFVTVPCHGGEKNSCAEWYDALSPEQAIVSVGKNYAGYPSNQAIADVGAYCQPMYTEYDGNITVAVKGGKYTVEKSK